MQRRRPLGSGRRQATVCTSEPGRRAGSAGVRLRPAGSGSASLRPRRPGRHPLTVTAFGATIERVLVVRPASRRLRVLATGDSMIQIIDGDLQRRLAQPRSDRRAQRRAHLDRDLEAVHVQLARARARDSVRSLHPDVTVMFLGANDGFPMGTSSGRKVPLLQRRRGCASTRAGHER